MSTRGSIKLAVITGNHPFEVPEFIRLFSGLPDVEFYPQYLENFAADLSGVREWYDVVLFYNMHPEPPDDASRAALEKLGSTDQGVFLLHHGMLAFRGWQHWSNLVGIEDRRFTYHPGEKVPVNIADPDHPIVQGMDSWEMVDETYAMNGPDAASGVILTTEHPRSLQALAWTRQFRRSRVFVFASGHGKETYADESFRKVLLNGIRWAARRL